MRKSFYSLVTDACLGHPLGQVIGEVVSSILISRDLINCTNGSKIF